MKLGIRFALALVSTVLVISLVANGILYNALSENNNLEKQNEEMQNQINSLQSLTQNLQSQVTELQNQSKDNNRTIAAFNAQIFDLQTQNSNLQNQNDNLTYRIQSQLSTEKNTKPYLVTALGAVSTESLSPTGWVKYLYIQGTVTNQGNGTAYNCVLKVTSHTPSTTYVDYYRFNSLAPAEYATVDTHIYHDNIQSWEIIPECTNTP
jgi:TolA-binding protein